MEKINIAEILKDCPSGMELDCTVFENLTFEEIDEVNSRILCNTQGNNGKIGISFNKFGCYSELNQAKSVIFPKGKTTWEGFVPPCKFKDGDILYVDTNDNGDNDDCFKYVFIFEKMVGNKVIAHCYTSTKRAGGFLSLSEGYLVDDTYPIRFATKEEKQKLFDAIKENGYKWNAETKTLEKLNEPIFKVGDRIQWYGNHVNRPIRVVKSLECDRYRLDNGSYIKFGDEHAYKLLKFDITTLVPFESRVLVRDSNKKWRPAIYGFCDKFETRCAFWRVRVRL